MTIINKKDETILYNIDYIKKNLDLKKFVNLLEKKSFAEWFLNPSADPNVENFNIEKCAIESCSNEKNLDPNINDIDGFPEGENLNKFQKLEWFFHPYEYHSENNVIEIKDKYKKEYKEYEKALESHKNEGTFLETISSNFKSFYIVKVAETLKEFKAKEFETHSIIYSKINDKYYYVFNMPNDYRNLIVKIDDKLIDEYEFIELIINRFGEEAIINNDGNTLGDLYEKVL